MDPEIAPLLPPPPPSHSSSSDTSFPILALSILGILTTSILLLSYYIFVIKCCLNFHRPDVVGRLSRSRRRREDSLVDAYSTVIVGRGLGESAIQAIPTFRYNRGGNGNAAEKSSFHECAVCLNEFQEEERIRLLPNCLHVFHIDCIDTWLQTNANCPLCRSPITTTTPILADHFVAPTTRRDEEDVVIDIRDGGIDQDQSMAQMESLPRKREEKGIKLKKGGSMGDECIDVRSKDEQFGVQPIRRSFSMDSSSDWQMYVAVQAILQQNRPIQEVGFNGESSSNSSISNSSGRLRRSLFKFGHHRSSRSAVLPI
ncbi:RING-H2 finger protein ATL16-like [Typha angustifolia]|uniref:RING-H2 finger protein ATL16-like n=1 Tax=Typha angustifolia TaxID=59011 RepID=UPI003C2C9644